MLFLVAINWKGQVFEFYTNSRSQGGALYNALKRLAKEVGYSFYYVRNEVKGNSYTVTQVKEGER